MRLLSTSSSFSQSVDFNIPKHWQIQLPANGIQFFCFYIHLCQKAPALEVGFPPPSGSVLPPTGNPGSTTAKGKIGVVCIFFIKCYSAHIDNVVLNRNWGNVHKLENRLHQGYQLYEAVFDPPVTVTSGKHHTIIFSNNLGSEFRATEVSGQNTLQFRDSTIDVSVTGDPWYFIVGFKLRNC